jgi:hypothetical protein
VGIYDTAGPDLFFTGRKKGTIVSVLDVMISNICQAQAEVVQRVDDGILEQL